ncbi:glucose 1-dehydrogenase [uncultured Desulfosarcina sp.]|uniref:glucose 1-dehydrogenase n=1 Tax=uncultured Desulfosarcina sp. TaxID=218289 RepID=UPI0029C84563|nr:glucose 1-dehydrogenase [uncultured Desulfosarcina sp.]
MGRMDGKVSIVTGGAMGIGEAIVRFLAREGSNVVVSDINEAKGRAVAESTGKKALFVRHDVSDENQWIGIIEKTLSVFGRLDVLVNNAGIVQVSDVEQTTMADWRAVHAVHMDGTFLGCKHAIPAMRQTGGGSIVNMSSTAAIGGYPKVFAYSASKGAIRAMTKSIAVHCAQMRNHIRCNSVHPGTIETPLVRQFLEAVADDPTVPDHQKDPMRGTPEDVANMVLFLASDESRHVNGAEFLIDNTTTITEGIVPK